MIRYLKIPFLAGAETCAEEPGKFCPFALVSHFGKRFTCQLFRPDHQLREANGWLQRWPECMRSEVKTERANLEGLDPWEIWEDECEKAKVCLAGVAAEDCAKVTLEAAERLLSVARILAGKVHGKACDVYTSGPPERPRIEDVT